MKSVSIGFTGSREGTTLAQRHTLMALCRSFSPYVKEAHHGGARGADDVFHLAFHLALTDGLATYPTVFVHPCRIKHEQGRRWKAEKPVSVTVAMRDAGYRVLVEEEDAPLKRNRTIVDRVSLLIAMPAEDKQQRRSGTWSTVRYAIQTKKTVLHILASGKWNLYGNLCNPHCSEILSQLKDNHE